VGFASRTNSSAKSAAQLAGAADQWYETPWEATERAEIVFITPPDGFIREVCNEIAENKGFHSKTAVFHCSGALSSDELAEARKCGAAVGSLHPLQSFATETSGNPFAGILVAVEGDARAVALAGKMAADLGAEPIAIKTSGKILYHAAAVVASNYLVTLMGLAVDLMAGAGVAGPEAFRMLKPLIQGTIANIEEAGVVNALTGPIVRGDATIVEKHLAAIRELSPDMARLYSALGRETIKIAKTRGTLSASVEQKLFGIFNDLDS
jgi:predicted short-subunit dehydrogenase-like oxidoreductase (DUF2520 family)